MANRIEFKSAGAVRVTRGTFKIRYTNEVTCYFSGRVFDDLETAMAWAKVVGVEAEIIRLRGLGNPRKPHEVVARFTPGTFTPPSAA